MIATPRIDLESPRTDRASTSSLDSIRATAQGLHSAISDAAVEHGAARMDRLLAAAPSPALIIAALRPVIGEQPETAKTQLTEVIALLEGAEAQIDTCLKSTGQAFHTAVRQALADSRSAVQKISEVVAAARSARATLKTKA